MKFRSTKTRRILVINPPSVPFTDRSLLIEPIDVLTVASFLAAEGHEVKLIDMDVQQKLPSDITGELDNFSPDIAVIPFDYHIPLFTSEAAAHVIGLIDELQSREIFTVLGGRPAKTYPGHFLRADAVAIVIGEMEMALREIATLDHIDSRSLMAIPGIIFRSGGEEVRTGPRKERIRLDELPIPDRNLVDLSSYIEVRTLLSSRGCVERCGFCPVHSFWGSWRGRSPRLVVDEIEQLVDVFNARKILFLDDHATADPRRMRAICTGLIERGVKTSLGCLGTVTSVDRKTLELMREAGFRWIHFGAEFASDEVLAFMRKRTRVSDITEAFRAARDCGLRIRSSWIFDAPLANAESLQRTADLILEWQPEEVRVHFLSLRADSPFANEFRTGRPDSQQYIHADRPHSSFRSMNPETIVGCVERMSGALADEGYLVIRRPDEWRVFDDPVRHTPDVRFVSFCPGRYGIGWQI